MLMDRGWAACDACGREAVWDGGTCVGARDGAVYGDRVDWKVSGGGEGPERWAWAAGRRAWLAAAVAWPVAASPSPPASLVLPSLPVVCIGCSLSSVVVVGVGRL